MVLVKMDSFSFHRLFKVERHYLPMFEVTINFPSYVYNLENSLLATVEGGFITERQAKGYKRIIWYYKSNEVKLYHYCKI